MNRGREEVSEYAKTAEDLGFAAVGITMDTVRPVKIGDEVPLSTKDGKPRKGHKSTTQGYRVDETAGRAAGRRQRHYGRGRRESTAVNSGADALIVSNHGGRILDFNRSALEALPEVVEAVGGKVPVLLDSGVRSGGDIVKALALGAKAVLIGRPVAWGVGAFGARGVERVFAILAEEMQRVLTMTGVAHVRDVSRSILFRDELGGLRGL